MSDGVRDSKPDRAETIVDSSNEDDRFNALLRYTERRLHEDALFRMRFLAWAIDQANGNEPMSSPLSRNNALRAVLFKVTGDPAVYNL